MSQDLLRPGQLRAWRPRTPVRSSNDEFIIIERGWTPVGTSPRERCWYFLGPDGIDWHFERVIMSESTVIAEAGNADEPGT